MQYCLAQRGISQSNGIEAQTQTEQIDEKHTSFVAAQHMCQAVVQMIFPDVFNPLAKI